MLFKKSDIELSGMRETFDRITNELHMEFGEKSRFELLLKNLEITDENLSPFYKVETFTWNFADR